MTFRTAIIKLTFFYMLIIMFISFVFSIVIYRISCNEIDRGLGRQLKTLRQMPTDQFLSRFSPDIEEAITNQIKESRENLIKELIYLNLIILILSGLGSYFLAKKTLSPIEDMVLAQNRFTADASHELKTPLAAMRSEIEVGLRQKKFSLDDAKSLLASNLEEIEKLEALSNALLKLARYQEEVKLSFEKISLSDVIVEAYEKIQALAHKKHIEFENELIEVSAKGDKQSLTELFIILLDNAIKYSPEKSTISIKMKKTDKNVTVSIKDQGIGIKASDLPYIFNRFYRSDLSRSKEQVAGYGLGLSIAKRIVDLHDGEITATSQPGKGSEFTVKLSRF